MASLGAMTRLEHESYLAHIAAESRLFREALTDVDPAARVPACPEWTADDRPIEDTDVVVFAVILKPPLYAAGTKPEMAIDLPTLKLVPGSALKLNVTVVPAAVADVILGVVDAESLVPGLTITVRLPLGCPLHVQ